MSPSASTAPDDKEKDPSITRPKTATRNTRTPTVHHSELPVEGDVVEFGYSLTPSQQFQPATLGLRVAKKKQEKRSTCNRRGARGSGEGFGDGRGRSR